MEFVSPIITSVVQSLMVPIKKHLGFFVFSTKYVKKMNAKVKQLNATAQEVEARWTAAVGNTEVVPKTVEPWLEDAKSLNERSNLIEAIGCLNVAKRYKVGKQSYDILEEIKDLEMRESKIMFTHAQIPLAEVGSTSASVNPTGTQISDFGSRDLIFKSALQALQSTDESQKMIALCGMGGVGKTTMMEQLKKVVEDSNMFDLVVKVVIGETSDAISLQQAIAQYIGTHLTESTKDSRADRLRKTFEAKSQQGQKKILIIMDDLWNEVDLNDVGLSPLPHGFKMLFTSRFENVCTRMGVETHSIFRIGILSKTEAKKLFSITVGPSLLDGDDTELQSIGEDIAMKCGGLPIAIVTIAKNLRGDIKEAWQEVLGRLEKDDLNDLETITHRIFEISYESLKGDDDKAIFVLCSIFPDDFDIRIEDLLRYGWGLTFFKDAETLAIARRHIKICVNNLIRANLLTESGVNGCVKMHDLVRAFVLTNFSKFKQVSIVNHENMSVQTLRNIANKSCERVLLKCTNVRKVPRAFNYSDLSLLILMDGYKLKNPEDLCERMEKLKVMSYEKLGMPLLPVMFEHSIKLRTLCLRSCLLINDISFLGSLHNLEILSLVDCGIKRLPSMIGKLKKLKLLDLSLCINLHIDDGVIQSLVNLEELYMTAYLGSRIRFTHANCVELVKLSQHLSALELEFFAHGKIRLKNMSFENLERFNISIGCELEMKRHKNSLFKNKLNLVSDCSELLECNINDLFEKTEELKLQVNDMYNLEDVLMHHTFSQLQVFHVSKCANLVCLFTTVVASSLKKLERLIISDCCVLKALVSENSGVRVATFHKLKFMSLEGLPNMVSLCNSVINFPELAELRLSGLPNFAGIYHDNNNNMSAMQPLLNRAVVFPKLEILYISMIPNLQQIWPSEKNDVSMLRQIKVRECDSLVNLFPSNPLPLLNHLEELVVENCASIEVVFNIDFECICEMEEHNSRLRRIEVRDMQKLKELWRIRSVNHSDIIINCFKGVQSIVIEDCKQFIDVFTPRTTNFDLSALSTYRTVKVGCDVLEESYRNNNSLAKRRDQEINATYPSYLLHTWHNLQHLELGDDERVEEVVFEMDSPCSRRLATIQQPLLLPYLEGLVLSSLRDVSHVWKCNWNKFLNPQQPPFQNLIYIYLKDCHKVKYLFSPLMAKYLSNLKTLLIRVCDGIEQVISSRDDENEENTPHGQNTTFFPRLNDLELELLPCLKSIDETSSMRSKISTNLTNTIHGQSKSAQANAAFWSLCQYPRRISISKCDALSILIPWYAIGKVQRLEKLYISSSKTLMEVFESESINNVDEGSADGTTLTSPSLKNIPSVLAPQLSNLELVSIFACGLLSHIFTFSALESLKQLKELKVERCNAIQVIVKEDNKISSRDVVFPCLERLKLINLPNLKGFFLGMNDFRWPLLDDVTIIDCPQMMVFTSGQSKTPMLKYIQTRLGKHSLECGLNFPRMTDEVTFPASSSLDPMLIWSFHNLIEINTRALDGITSIIPSNVLQQLQKLERIQLYKMLDVKEVFEVVTAEGNESQTIVKIPSLTQMALVLAYDLKYLWKSNQWLVLEFPNLTTILIFGCKKLEHVFTCSMVGSLVQLQDLYIRSCKNIEVIVKEEEEEEECDDKVNETIQLPRLKSLKLDQLASLKGFCLGKKAFSLPTMDTLYIKSCPEFTLFNNGDLSTPDLKIIDSDFGICYVGEDLNSFIKTKLEEDASSYDYEDDVPR